MTSFNKETPRHRIDDNIAKFPEDFQKGYFFNQFVYPITGYRSFWVSPNVCDWIIEEGNKFGFKVKMEVRGEVMSNISIEYKSKRTQKYLHYKS
jgi:hypothetical protein